MEAFPLLAKTEKGPMSLAPSFFSNQCVTAAGAPGCLSGWAAAKASTCMQASPTPRRLAGKADVADRRLLTAAEAAGHPVVREVALDRVERFAHPMPGPFQH